MLLGLVLLSAFYIWRFTVYAASVGGYWSLLTGKHHLPQTTTGVGMRDFAASAAASVNSARASSSSTVHPDFYLLRLITS